MFTFSSAIKPDEPALITNLFARRLAHPFALAAHRLGLSANAVTVLGGCCWMLSTPLAVLAGGLCARAPESRTGLALWFGCGVLWNLGYILDLADGSLARMSGTASRRGFYLDYVFHLLFKPAFLSSVGIGLALLHGTSLPLLLLAVLAIPANWSASASAAEHVLCEETGKNHAPPLPRPGDGIADPAAGCPTPEALWLGLSDISQAAAAKRASPVRFVRTLAAEILSYYGQFTFFSVTVLSDILLALFVPGIDAFPCTTLAFVVLTLFLLLRIPLRVLRDYRRFGSL